MDDRISQIIGQKKVKSSMARSLPVENLLPQNVGSIINYLQYTEAAQRGTPSCSQPQPATDNGVGDGRSNWLVAPPTLMGSTPWAPRAWYKSVHSAGFERATAACEATTLHMLPLRVIKLGSLGLRIEALKLLELTRFLSPNISTNSYFLYFRSVLRIHCDRRFSVLCPFIEKSMVSNIQSKLQ